MHAIVLRSAGDFSILEYSDFHDPVPGKKEVCVHLMAASVNRRDISLRKRASSASMLPLILGSDGAGIIDQVGEEVNGWEIGEEVVINPALNWGPSPRHSGPKFRILGGPDHGTYAEKIVVPAENIAKKPDLLSFQEAAACPVGTLTAWRALVTMGNVQAGDNVLIPGIGSGVATFALQIAIFLGAKVYVTSHSADKLQIAQQLGAAGTAKYTDSNWPERFKDLTNGYGFDIILDSVGSPIFSIGLDLLAPGGRLITFGATRGAEVACNVRQIYSNHLQILGTTLGTPMEFEAALLALATGKIKPIIDRVFPLIEADLAHQRLEAGLQFGKIVLEIE